MIWLKKKMKKLNVFRNGTTIGNLEKMGKALDAFNKVMLDRIQNRTHTGQPKGKVGKLIEIPYWQRNAANGNKRWFFRKFEHKTFNGPDAFIRGLEKRGFKKLGSGAFSTVLAKDGHDRVIKVIRRPDGWIEYVRWAAQIGEAGHFAPKVFSYKKIKGLNSHFAVATMERLEYTLSDAPEEHALKILPDLAYHADKNAIAANFADILAPGLMEFLKKMAEKWEIPIRHFDLHGGNLMLRKDGGFVVVDPVSRSRGEDIIRLREGDFGPLTVKLLAMTGFIIENSNRYRSQWA